MLEPTLTRRTLIRAGASLAAGAVVLPHVSRGAHIAPRGGIRVGVIGCGGRGTGAAHDALHASPDTIITALGDAMPDRLAGCRANLEGNESFKGRVQVTDETCFHGLDAYQRVLAAPVDVVILATPPGFRPIHFAAAIDAGKHVFMEKPVAVDPAGVRTVLAAAARAREKKLNVVSGTQRRHEACYLAAMERIRDGAIGCVLGANVSWNQGGLWMHPRKPEWSDTEWQLRNWLYFTWLSGDHICEQHVHNIDAALWALGDDLPSRALGLGGREVRTSPDYGHVFDHFGVTFEYDDGRFIVSQCRQIDGCAGRVEEIIYGSEGSVHLSSGRAQIKGKNPWRWEDSQPSPYVAEHVDLIAGVTGGPYINEGERIARSTLVAIAGRESAYTGATLALDRVLNADLCLMPVSLELPGTLAMPEVAVPGRTKLPPPIAAERS
jgi:predicted dehydrogenase